MHELVDLVLIKPAQPYFEVKIKTLLQKSPKRDSTVSQIYFRVISQRQVTTLMEAGIKGRRNEVITGGWESLLMGMGFQTEGVPPKFTTYHLDGEEFKCISPR
ncbi:hypothetical protein CDAR_518501 [Caerostris darwini]|uniref:Uncharacterized protein n=1 Tax=Caerostris darwini TaxID=1538125 RepID=A0AAV4UW27_9ARAC|nr:hypothetical protein CDAR_518501 [Caerostris darwini]